MFVSFSCGRIAAVAMLAFGASAVAQADDSAPQPAPPPAGPPTADSPFAAEAPAASPSLPPPPIAPADSPLLDGWPARPGREGVPPRRGLAISGYVQPQFERSQLSVDEVTPDGGPLNQDRFLVRRGRLRVERGFQYGHTLLEVDANTVRGPFLSLRRAEATVFYPHTDPTRPAWVALNVGVQEIPFGFELRQGAQDRVFMERSVGSLAFFRGEPDTGARLNTAAGPLRLAVAVQNGVPLDDRPGAITVPYQKKKTLVGRFGAETAPGGAVEAAGGVSFLQGQGLRPGEPPSKAELLWRDLNQDGLVTLNELTAAPGVAVTPSETFDRWALNADAQFGFRTPLGWTRLQAEGTLASNLDRGLYIADPIAAGYDLREVSWVVALIQDIGSHGILAFRADRYDPNTDFFETRRGLFLPEDLSILTLSPAVGARLDGVGRIIAQYDYVVDQLGRDLNANPIDLPNDLVTVRLQMEF